MSGGFAAWCGATCASCGLPALLHAADGCDEMGLLANALQRDSLIGICSPTSGARYAPSFPCRVEAEP